jgi:hypothetical protein
VTGVYDAIIVPTVYHVWGYSHGFVGYGYNDYYWAVCNFDRLHFCCPSWVGDAVYPLDPLVDLLQISHQLEDSYFVDSRSIMPRLALIYDMLGAFSSADECDYEFPCSYEQENECRDMFDALVSECIDIDVYQWDAFQGEDEILYCEQYLLGELDGSISLQLDSSFSGFGLYLTTGRDRVGSLARILPMNKFFNYSDLEAFYREIFDYRDLFDIPCDQFDPERGSRMYQRYIDERNLLDMDRGRYIGESHLRSVRSVASSAVGFWKDQVQEDRFNKMAPLWVEELTTALLDIKNALLSWDCPEWECTEWFVPEWNLSEVEFDACDYGIYSYCYGFRIGGNRHYVGVFLREKYLERVNTLLDLLPALLEDMRALSNYFEIFSLVNNGIVSYAEGGLDWIDASCSSLLSTCPCEEIDSADRWCLIDYGCN